MVENRPYYLESGALMQVMFAEGVTKVIPISRIKTTPSLGWFWK